MGSLIIWVVLGGCLGGLAWYGFNYGIAIKSNSKGYEWSGPVRWDFSKPNAPLWISGGQLHGEEAMLLKVRAFNAFGRILEGDDYSCRWIR